MLYTNTVNPKTYELLNHYSLEQMVEYYQTKYPNSDIGHVIIAMTYFVDAELQKNNPDDLKGVTWSQVKAKMKNTVEAFVRKNI